MAQYSCSGTKMLSIWSVTASKVAPTSAAAASPTGPARQGQDLSRPVRAAKAASAATEVPSTDLELSSKIFLRPHGLPIENPSDVHCPEGDVACAGGQGRASPAYRSTSA